MEQLWHDSALNNECKDEHFAQLSVNRFGFSYVSTRLMSKINGMSRVTKPHPH